MNWLRDPAIRRDAVAVDGQGLGVQRGRATAGERRWASRGRRRCRGRAGCRARRRATRSRARPATGSRRAQLKTPTVTRLTPARASARHPRARPHAATARGCSRRRSRFRRSSTSAEKVPRRGARETGVIVAGPFATSSKRFNTDTIYCGCDPVHAQSRGTPRASVLRRLAALARRLSRRQRRARSHVRGTGRHRAAVAQRHHGMVGISRRGPLTGSADAAPTRSPRYAPPSPAATSTPPSSS